MESVFVLANFSLRFFVLKYCQIMAKAEIPYYRNMPEIPPEDRDSAWYLARFKESWARLRPVYIQGKIENEKGQEFIIRSVKVEPLGVSILGIEEINKLADVIFGKILSSKEQNEGDHFEIMIASRGRFPRPSGYFQERKKIIKGFGLEKGVISEANLHWGVIFEDMDGRRFMILQSPKKGLLPMMITKRRRKFWRRLLNA